MTTYACPKCGMSDDLETMTDEAKDQSEDWDNTSQMKCGCGYSDVTGEFKN